MNTEQLILSVGTILLAARALGWIFQRIGQPHAQGKRQHDADIADQHHCGALLHDAFEIDLKTYYKHEE